jgi:phosphonate dehydrogenase
MRKPRAVVTHPIFPETRAFLETHAEIEVNPGLEPWPESELLRRCAEAEALMAFMTDRIDAGFLASCPRLRVVACALKGWDNFDPRACEEAGVWLTAVPDLLTEPTAELALGLAIGLGRQIPAGDRLMRTVGFAGWRAQLYGAGLAGATVGIAGHGKVGQAIERRLRGFEPARVMIFDQAQPGAPWEDLLSESDFLFLALPLTPATRRLLDESALARMKRTSRIVNIGRGSVVDESAIAHALASGRLAGYAADVFEMEDWALSDRPREIPAALLAMTGKTLFTPHVGSAVIEVRRAIERAAAENLAAALSGLRPPDAINNPSRLRSDA